MSRNLHGSILIRDFNKGVSPWVSFDHTTTGYSTVFYFLPFSSTSEPPFTSFPFGRFSFPSILPSYLSLSSDPSPLSSSLPSFFPPSRRNKSQSVYNPSGTLHNSSGSNCRSIYTRQCRGLASLIWDSVLPSVYPTVWLPELHTR